MANTVVQRTLTGVGSTKYVIRHIHIISDGSEESNLIVYDNSTFINDPLKGALEEIWATGNSCTIRLSWDQTTDSAIISMDPVAQRHLSFKDFGGIQNPGATGATGDIFLNTANLDSGDEVMLILKIRQ